MIELIKLNFQIIWKRGRLLNYAVVLTVFSSVLSLFFYRVLNIAANSDYMSEFILLNSKADLFMFLLLYLIPLAVTFPDGDIGIIERKIYPQIFTRVEAKRYLSAKAITEFLVGFLIMFFFFGLMYIFMLSMINHDATYFQKYILRFSNPMKDSIGYSILFVNHPHLYNFLYIFYISIYGGVLSLTAYILGIFIKSKVVAYIGPFVLSVLFALLVNLIGYPFSSAYPQLFLNPFANRLLDEGWFSLERVIPLILLLHIFFLTVFLQLKKWMISRK